MLRKVVPALAGLSLFLSAEVSFAQEEQMVGPETGFPIPRFVSMRSAKANVRRGPTTDHQIDWVFERAGLPVVVTGEFGHWRQIQDPDGDRGWVHRALISGVTMGMAQLDEVPVRETQAPMSDVIAIAKKGVLVRIEECQGDSCLIFWKEVAGWVAKDSLWGTELPEIFQ